MGRVLGTGEGRGGALLFVLLGVLILWALAIAASTRELRDVETELPDAVQPQEEAVGGEERGRPSRRGRSAPETSRSYRSTQ